MTDRSIVVGVNELLGSFAKNSPDQTELVRLQDFLKRMKEAGVATTREYSIPRPDTLGRAFVDKKRNTPT